MALATSGALTLDQIHVEAGGSSGTTASLNDTDIRGLYAASGRTINSTQGTNIDFADFYGAYKLVVDLTASGTSGTQTTTIGSGKTAVTYVYNGIGTTFSGSTPGSWSDQTIATASGGAFKIYDCLTIGGVGGGPFSFSLIIDSSAGQGQTWTSFSGYRYLKDGSGNIIFDGNVTISGSPVNGVSSPYGTQGGGATSGTNGTRWYIAAGYSRSHLPTSGSISFVLSN